MMTDEDLKRIKEDRGPLDLTLKIEQLELANKSVPDAIKNFLRLKYILYYF